MLSRLRRFVTTNLNEFGVLLVAVFFLGSAYQAFQKDFGLAATLLTVAVLLPVFAYSQRQKLELVASESPSKGREYGVGLHTGDTSWVDCPKIWCPNYQEAVGALSAIRFALVSIGAKVVDDSSAMEEYEEFRIVLMHDNQKLILRIDEADEGILLY